MTTPKQGPFTIRRTTSGVIEYISGGIHSGNELMRATWTSKLEDASRFPEQSFCMTLLNAIQKDSKIRGTTGCSYAMVTSDGAPV